MPFVPPLAPLLTSARPPCYEVAMIKDFAFIAYSVRDVPAAAKFYGDMLGLEKTDESGEHWVEFNVGKNNTFGIGNGEDLGFIPGKSTGLSFEVDDVNAMHDKLAKQGVKISEVHKFPNCSACFVTDPEGNVFGLHQRGAGK